PGAASGRTPSRPLCGPCREVPMRYFRIRALLPALALVLALATAVRADCSHELGLEWTSDTAVLIGTEERLQEAYLPISLWPALPVIVKVTQITEVGTYLMPDGSRLRVVCDERM